MSMGTEALAQVVLELGGGAGLLQVDSINQEGGPDRHSDLPGPNLCQTLRFTESAKTTRL